MPTHCPVCGEPVSRPEGEAVTRCVNARCPAQALEHIIHWASKGAMDIDGLGEKVATRFFDLGLIKDPADIYDLEAEQISPSKASARRARRTWWGHREEQGAALPPRFVRAGYPARRVGDGRAHSRTLRRRGPLRGVSVEQLVEINGVGGVVARAVVEYFALDDNRDLVERLMGSASTSRG